MTLTEGLADLGSALGALQKASNIIKEWASLATDKERAAKFSELNGQILSAQTSAIQANAAQASLIEQIGALKAEIARFETWDAEKRRYDLCKVGGGALPYVLKKESSNGEPPHWICPTCYQNCKRSILQSAGRAGTSGMDYRRVLWACPNCKSAIRTSHGTVPRYAEETMVDVNDQYPV